MRAFEEAAEKIKPLLKEMHKIKEAYGLERMDAKACVNRSVIKGYQKREVLPDPLFYRRPMGKPGRRCER